MQRLVLTSQIFFKNGITTKRINCVYCTQTLGDTTIIENERLIIRRVRFNLSKKPYL